MRVLLLLVALIVTAAAAVPQKQNPQRIMGGEPTTIERYPYMADMQFSYAGGAFRQSCGGALITRRSILSAAQCYSGNSQYEWRAHLGSSFHAYGGSAHEVSRIIIHEQHDRPSFVHDVAIIKLTIPVVLSNTIGLARIAGPDYNLADGAPLTVIGWGSQAPSGAITDQLHYAEVTQINQELCSERYAYLKTQWGYYDWPLVTDGMICDGIPDVGGKGSCRGDAGGPLIHAGDVIVGVASWGYRCGDPNYPAVNARVAKYTPWIVANSS